MSEGLVRSFGNSNDAQRNTGFDFWLAVERMFEKFDGALRRPPGSTQTVGFARDDAAGLSPVPDTEGAASASAPIRLKAAAIATSLNPRADALEDDDGFEIAVELPGVKPDDIDIEFDSGGLVIKAERRRTRPEDEMTEKKAHLRERSFGAIERRFALPFQANPDIIEASFEDGVVVVTIPRPPETKPRTRKIGLKR